MPGRIRLIALCLAITPAAFAQTSLTPFTGAPNAPTPTNIRLGEPITFAARVLPADATGTVTFLIDGVPAQTVPLATQALTDTVALGDDITYAGYLADPTQRYPALLAQSLAATASNLAAIGATACDLMPLEILPNNIATTPATSPLYSVLVGKNDVAIFGIGAHEGVFNLCQQAALAWIGVPRANKLLLGDANIAIASGSWSTVAAPASCCLSAFTNTTGSGTLRFTQSTGSIAYLWYAIDPSNSGSFTVSVDGGPASASIQTQQAIPAASYGLLRLDAAPGSHTFDIAAQSGTVTILGMGYPSASAAPTILVADIPNQIGGNATAIAVYTADIQSNIALLRADGLDARFVPTQQSMLATPAEMMDATHPNAVGLAEIAQAFESIASSPNPTAAATANYTTSTLPLGAHTVDMTYSGDVKYLPSYAATTSITIYHGASSSTLTSDAAIYPAHSPITLTASIPQPNATGQVIFSDESGPIGSAWLGEHTPGQAQLILPNLPSGSHTISAQYLGDITYNASASAPISIIVSGTYTTTSLTAPATRFYAATPIPLTATVAPASAPGTITFSDGSSTLGQVPIVAGTGTLTTATLAPGIHSLTAAYSGSATADPSASPALSIEIDLNATGITFATIPATVAYGTPLSIALSVEPATATGTVMLLDGTQSVGQVALANGNANFVAANLLPGSHTLTALYSGDANDLPSSASASTQITLAPTTVGLAPVPPTNVFGSPVILTANVVPVASTGTVTFFDGSANLAQIPVAAGTASIAIPTLAPGQHSFTAAYSGDTLRLPATSAAVSISISPDPATIALASLPATVNAGNPIVLSAAISPASATGTVVFRDATLGVLGQSTVAHGASTLTLANPAVGLYSIAATYSGDTDDTAAASAPASTQVILNPTATTLTASPGTAPFATLITLTANVAPTTATGSVTFLDGGTPLGTALLVNGSASFSTARLSPGTHPLRANYSGDALRAASSSAAISQTITPANTTTSINLAQNPVVASAQIIADVAVSSSANSPTGTVSIRSGSTVLGTGTLANASNGFAYATITFNAATLGIGNFPITATYSGDADDQTSSASTNVTIAAIPTTTTLTLSTTQIPIQGSVTLAAAVAPSASGSITFLSNGSPLATAPASAATYVFTPPSIGTYVLTAVFTPTGLYAGSSPAGQTLVVTPPLSAALNPASVNATPGSTASATLTLAPLSGFSGPIQTTCTSSVPFITCTVDAPQTLSTTTSAPVQIIVSRTTSALLFPVLRGGATIALAVLLPLLARRKGMRYLIPSAFVCMTLWIAGCAQGGSFNSIPAGPQTVTFTITAANTPITAALIVNVAN